jgi:hypothetical protein
MSFMAPAPEHTICVVWGFTSGEAMATPNDKTIHTKTQRAMRRAVWGKYIRGDLRWPWATRY